MKINGRRRENHIHRLKHKNGWITDHEQKEKTIFDHFEEVIVKVIPAPRILIGRGLISRSHICNPLVTL
jgi:hypothetical protein